MTHWLYNHEPVTSRGQVDPTGKSVGFTYRIIDLKRGMMYAGKKQWVTGKKRPREDWQKYTGSSEHVNELIANEGIQDFHFHIKSVHDTDLQLRMAEAQAILTLMLEHPQQCYNRSVSIHLLNWRPKP